MCSSSGGQNCIIQHLVSSHSLGGRPVHRLREDLLAPTSPTAFVRHSAQISHFIFHKLLFFHTFYLFCSSSTFFLNCVYKFKQQPNCFRSKRHGVASAHQRHIPSVKCFKYSDCRQYRKLSQEKIMLDMAEFIFHLCVYLQYSNILHGVHVKLVLFPMFIGPCIIVIPEE